MSKVTSKKLTERELETLYFVTIGYNNRQIAQKLKISQHTVKAHLESIYRKFGVHNKVQASIYAVYHNIIDIEEVKTSLPAPPPVQHILTKTPTRRSA